MNDPKIILWWMDTETTGLDPQEDELLEIAWNFTDYRGVPLGVEGSLLLEVGPLFEMRGARIADTAIGDRRPVVRDMHIKSGLWNDLFFPTEGAKPLSWQEARRALHTGLDEAVESFPQGEYEYRLAGSSVDFDRNFLRAKGLLTDDMGVSHRVHDLSVFRPMFKAMGLEVEDLDLDGLMRPHRAWHDIGRDLMVWQRAYAKFEELAAGKDER